MRSPIPTPMRVSAQEASKINISNHENYVFHSLLGQRAKMTLGEQQKEASADTGIVSETLGSFIRQPEVRRTGMIQ